MSSKLFILGVGVIVVVAALVLGRRTLPSSPQGQGEAAETAPAKDRLKWHAQKAKAAGQDEVIISGPIVEYDGSASSMTTDDMLSYYAVIKAIPTEELSYAADSNTVVTWYKFKTIESLSQPNRLACPNCPEPPLPQELLPLMPDEFLFCKSGGSLLIDGVKVRMLEEGFPPFKINQEYLLFVSKHPSGIAEIGGGPLGTYALDNGGKMVAVNGRAHPIKERVARELGTSLDEVKQKIRNRLVR